MGSILQASGGDFLMNNYTNPKWRAFKIIEGLRMAMEYFIIIIIIIYNICIALYNALL